MKKITIIFMILISTLLFCGCENKNNPVDKEETLKWTESDFEKYGLKDLNQPSKYDINVYDKNVVDNNTISISLKCKKECTTEDATEYSQILFDKANSISSDGLYNYSLDTDLKIVLNDKISSLKDAELFVDQAEASYRFAYKYNNKTIIVNLNGNPETLTISLSSK